MLGAWENLTLECPSVRCAPAGEISLRKFGAEEGIRTPTGLRPLRPERSASANSATSAQLKADFILPSTEFSVKERSSQVVVSLKILSLR